MSKPALVLIDVQEGFKDSHWGVRGQPAAETRMAELLTAFRKAGAPILHVQHCSTEARSPLRPDSPGNAFMDFARPAGREPVFQKNVNSAFIGTRLEQYLREQRIAEVLLIGLTTDHCVSTSTRMSANLGFKTYVAADATATFDRVGFDGERFSADRIHAAALASLHGEFATVAQTYWLLKALLGQ